MAQTSSPQPPEGRTAGSVELRSGEWAWALVPQGAARPPAIHYHRELPRGDELHAFPGTWVDGLTEREAARHARFPSERLWMGPGGRRWRLTERSVGPVRTICFRGGSMELVAEEPDFLGGLNDVGLGELTSLEIAQLLGAALARAAESAEPVAAPWNGRAAD